MAALTATSSATSSAQTLMLYERVRQAQRQAQSAQADAKTKRAQADQAELVSAQSTLRSRMIEAASTYERPRAEATSQAPSPSTQDFLVRMHQALSKDGAAAKPAKNSQGQTTGRIIDLTA